MNKLLLCTAAIVASLCSAHAVARDAKGVVELRVAPSALDPAKAYLLFKSSRAKSGMMGIEHTFVRVPTEAEIAAWQAARTAAYEAALPTLRKKAKDGIVPSIEEFAFDYDGPDNSFSTHSDRFLSDGVELRTFLMEVPPGDYVVYGVSIGGRALVSCNCLGTVAFTARAGAITNIGTLYADKVHKPSPFPALESNIGPSMFQYGFVMGQAVVPPSAGEAVPESVRGMTVEPARFRAVGPFHDRLAPNINRLAPIPGVLAYDHGKVVDVQAARGSK